jgi:alpha,alpha-trehalase
MVKDYFEKTGDVDFIEHALPILEKEYQFWLTNTTVTIKDASCDEEFQLNHYVTSNTSPRPESYTEDYLTVNQDTDYTDATKRQMYADIAAGAETGWDYSSRWTREKAPSPDQKENYEMLRSIETSNIIPIDLNALLWSMETNLALWSEKYGSRVRGARNTKYYKRQAKKRLRAMNTLMWNDEDHTYYDFNLTANAQSIEFTPANLFPFWLGALPKDKSALPYVFDQTEQALRKYPGILTSSLYNTSMQWDYPNGWPPQTYVALEAMLNINKQLDNQGVTGHGTSISHLAKVLADRYTASAFCGWYRTGGTIPGVLNKLSDSTDDDGHMFEKFDVNTIGVSGSQGEYVSQTGFGWTNGVAMWIFDQFENMVAPDCSTDVRYDI